MWRHLPNLLTILRMALVWPLFWLITNRHFDSALLAAALAGLSDALDGFLAKRFGWQSRLGGMLDPLADKLLLLATFLALALIDALPWWLLMLVVGRDVLIVSGAIAYHNLVGPFEAAPSRLSKLTTFAQIFCVLFELLRFSVWSSLPGQSLIHFATAALTGASGLHYVIVWSVRAWRTVHQRTH
jgi:cardiolipin synthase